MFIYQRLLLMSFCRKGGNSLWSQTSNCSLFNGVACCILRWSIFIVCLIVYCFCLVILVNVDYTHYNSFYFWEGWIYLRVSYVKFWMMIFSMDIVWSKYIIFMQMKFKKLWFSPSFTGSDEWSFRTFLSYSSHIFQIQGLITLVDVTEVLWHTRKSQNCA